MKETEKLIAGFENYSINTDGVVTNLMTGKVLVGGINSKGYSHVCLCKNGKQFVFTKHRLIAKAFIPNTENKPCINHINGIKTDNRLENLTWATYSENSQHAFDTGLKNSDTIKKVIIDTETGVYYESVNEAAKYHNICNTTLTKMLRGKLKNKTKLKFA